VPSLKNVIGFSSITGDKRNQSLYEGGNERYRGRYRGGEKGRIIIFGAICGQQYRNIKKWKEIHINLYRAETIEW
jgi:hypothetical protein